MKLGICTKGFWKDTLFDVDLPSGAWVHCSAEHVHGFSEDYFDFDEDHIVSYLLKHRHSWGLGLPEQICLKLKQKIDRSDKWYEWLDDQLGLRIKLYNDLYRET